MVDDQGDKYRAGRKRSDHIEVHQQKAPKPHAQIPVDHREEIGMMHQPFDLDLDNYCGLVGFFIGPDGLLWGHLIAVPPFDLSFVNRPRRMVQAVITF
jgi:hypothetical protein